MKVKHLKLLILNFSLFITFGFGCTEPPVPTLNAKERSLVDSLYKDTINYLKPLMDSMFALEKEARVQAAVDSMIEKRMGEIAKQLQRIQQFEKQQENENGK